jgi:hypothetical protein
MMPVWIEVESRVEGQIESWICNNSLAASIVLIYLVLILTLYIYRAIISADYVAQATMAT